ncbi:type II toxin-antitoxin system VapC family toxin [Thermodesulfobacteriota bacterium]
MNFLLDTCVLSELVKPRPNKKVIAWITSCREQNLFLSVITVGEIQKGVSLLPKSNKKNELHSWLESELIKRFDRRILGIDVHVARKWGEIQALSEKNGTPMPVIDSLIAAIGLIYDLTVTTRNTEDMKSTGVRLFNPWNQ